MKRNLLIVLAAAVVVIACGTKGSRYTTIIGSYSSSENAPEFVEVIIGNLVDTVITVTDGKFNARIPANKSVLSYIVSDNQPMQFVSDGSTITFDFMEKTVVSSNKKSPNVRLKEYLDWQNDFMSNYQVELATLPEAEQDAYMEKTLETYNAHVKEVIKANPDNVVALLCLSSLNLDDDAEMLELLNGLDKSLKESEDVQGMISALEASQATAEGKPFVDFTVVQDPENPETSTVKLSDYVGKGKFILVDFWASWCGPCKEETPYLQAVYKKFHGPLFDMVSVAISDDPAASKEAVEELGMTWNQIFNGQTEPAYLYGIQYIPHIILFGPDGTILRRNLRGEEIEKAVADAINM
jgi:thiol-disulfide isomerase/thioredoxin